MLTQKQWKMQCLTQHLQNLATNIAAEASRLSGQHNPSAKGLAVIAEETRLMSGFIMEALEKNIFGGQQNDEFDKLMLKMSRRAANLALNAGLLSCKEWLTPLCVYAEDLRIFSVNMKALFGNEPNYVDIPAISPKSAVITDIVKLFNATSGSVTWWENTQFIQEFMFYEPQYRQGNRYIIKNEWRDMDMPLIQLGDVPEDPDVVIIADAFDPNKLYAVLAESSLHALVFSPAGVSKPCVSEIPVRECWSASDGRDIIFPDWNKLSQQ